MESADYVADRRARRIPVRNGTPADGPLLMEAAALGPLHTALRQAGYRVIGPTVRDRSDRSR